MVQGGTATLVKVECTVVHGDDALRRWDCPTFPTLAASRLAGYLSKLAVFNESRCPTNSYFKSHRFGTFDFKKTAFLTHN